MHYWSDDETSYLKRLIDSEPRPSFSIIRDLFQQRFPDVAWTTSMISGRSDRLGLSKRDPHQRKAKAKEITTERIMTAVRQKVKPLPKPPFIPTKPSFKMVSMDKVNALFDEVVGCSCKWPMATGVNCNKPAGAEGYCEQHLTTVRRGVKHALISGD